MHKRYGPVTITTLSGTNSTTVTVGDICDWVLPRSSDFQQRLSKYTLHRQIISSPQWRNVLRIFGVDVDKLETVNYRSLCRAIIQEPKHIDQNWRTWNFQKTCKNSFGECFRCNNFRWMHWALLYNSVERGLKMGIRARPPNEPASNKFS